MRSKRIYAALPEPFILPKAPAFINRQARLLQGKRYNAAVFIHLVENSPENFPLR